METSAQFAKRIGREKIMALLGVGSSAVSKHVVAGKFPADWYVPLRDAGFDPPEHLFSWRRSMDAGSDDNLNIRASG